MTIPHNSQPLVGQNLIVAPVWAEWFRQIEAKAQSGVLTGDEATAAITAIAYALGSPDGTVANIPPQGIDLDAISITGEGPIEVTGSLSSGHLSINGRTISDSGAGSLRGITRDTYGRVSGTTDATITGTAGRITVANGDAAAGPPTVNIDVTYVGQNTITTLGTIATGVWQGTAVGAAYGGTGQTVYAVGDLLYASTTSALSKLSAGTSTHVLTSNGAGVAPSWQAKTVGDVVGPASAVTDRVATFNGTTGKLIKDGGYTITELPVSTPQAAADAALIIDSIADADTTHAPSRNAVFDALALKAGLTSNAFTGNQNIAPASGNAQYNLKAPASGNYAAFGFFTGSSIRWFFQKASDAESGSNAGSTFLISAYDDAGAYIGNALSIARATRHVLPGSDNVQNFGSAGSRWSTIYAGTGTINTSDAREKTTPRDMTPAEIAAAQDIARLPCVYQWLHAIEEKGDAARLHVSPTVQDVIAVMGRHGIDPFRWGFVCFDEWNETPEVVDEETGEVTQEYRQASDRYSLRPSELAHFIACGVVAGQDRIEARLAALEA